jgi:S1-C subfamily serine protease
LRKHLIVFTVALLVTGCGAPPSYSPTSVALDGSAEKNAPFIRLNLGLLLTDNFEKTARYIGELSGSAENAVGYVNEVKKLFNKHFHSAVIAKSFDDNGFDLFVLLDSQLDPADFVYTKTTVRFTASVREKGGTEIARVDGSGKKFRPFGGGAWHPEIPGATRDALAQLSEAMLGETTLLDFVESLEGAKTVREKNAPNKSPSSHSSSGSGFFVSESGHVLTNAHVVEECDRLTVGDSASRQLSADVISADRRNDLALLKLSSATLASKISKALIEKLGVKLVPLASDGLLRSEDVELGETVLVAGYPYGDIFSNTIKVTQGIVSAIRGIGDDSGQFQVDAAVQSGNSGGPIYDEYGNIVGVVVAQLDKLKVADALGSLPENVNFGIKASTVRQFLISGGLASTRSERTKVMANKELAKIAERQTLMVMCYQ